MNIRTNKPLNSQFSTLNSPRRAFTLIELLLVLVILGILAAIVVPKFSGRTEQAKEIAAKTQIVAFVASLDTYEVDNGGFPKGSEGLMDLVQAPSDVQSWKGPYMNKIPMDPWGRPYVYVCPGRNNPRSYDIYSVGADGREGTEDDVTNWDKTK